MAQGNLDQHAERCALTAAVNSGAELYTVDNRNAVLFVELHPCPRCILWLERGDGTGFANPYIALVGPHGQITLNVWYRWPHSAGVGDMKNFHLQTPHLQLQQITNYWLSHSYILFL